MSPTFIAMGLLVLALTLVNVGLELMSGVQPW